MTSPSPDTHLMSGWRRPFLLFCIASFLLVWLALLPMHFNLSKEFAFRGDAYHYNLGAIHLVREWFYSIDGITPFLEREPGQSTFLALIYRLFGPENFLAIYAVQGALYAAAAMIFVQQWERATSAKTAAITLVLLFMGPSIYHVIYSPYRESFALSQFLLLSAVFLSLLRKQTMGKTFLLGALFGILILTYYPYVFFPLFLCPLLLFLRMHWKRVAVIVCLPFLLASLWAARNFEIDGKFRVVGNFRSSIMWYARAEQAEHVRGVEPFLCLWSEYISRDWTGRSPACSTNALFHRQWPDGIPLGMEEQIAQESRQKILLELPSYLWFSVFEILELHLPFVNGWGFWYNVLAAIYQVILYIGCLLFLPELRKRWRQEYGLFLLLIGYTTAIFILTDATPRYLMPVIFCYAALAAVGYTTLLERLRFKATPSVILSGDEG